VYGQSDSNNGAGIVGEANDLTGSQVSYGVQGWAHSSKGVGVYGSSDWTNGDGTMIGVMGQVNHSSAVAGVFDNSANGTVISGRNNGNETFSVSSAGNVTATSYEGDGSRLTGVVTSSQVASLTSAIATLQVQIAILQANNNAMSVQIANLTGGSASTQAAQSAPTGTTVDGATSTANGTPVTTTRISRLARN
jgi:hypothetical protein